MDQTHEPLREAQRLLHDMVMRTLALPTFARVRDELVTRLTTVTRPEQTHAQTPAPDWSHA